MAKRLISLNFNQNIEDYINEQTSNILVDSPLYSQSFVPPSEGEGGTTLPNDYVKATTGGTFYGKVLYSSEITSFSGQELPTASWVETKINEAMASPIDFDALFDARFAQKSIADLGVKSHGDLEEVLGDGVYHLNSIQRLRVVNAASALADGYLTSNDWSTFNSKLSTINTGTGLTYSNNVLNLVLSQIDHNSLQNYSASRHPLLDDSQTTISNVWSADKIVNYVASQIPTIPTDFVSKSSGGSFDALVSYSSAPTIDNANDIPHKDYVDTAINGAINILKTSLVDTSGQDPYSVKVILNSLSLEDLGTKSHNSLSDVLGTDGETPYHVKSADLNIIRTKADATHDGYLSKEDWNTFNSKLGAFSVALDTQQTDFLRYDSGIMYYNPQSLDHNQLANYSDSRHPLLDDTQTTDSNVWSASKIMSVLTGSDFQSYRISLNSGATVSQRLSGLVEGTDYPTGWIITADDTALVIEHNLNKICSVVNVFSINGTTQDAVLLEGDIAYSTLTNEYYNGGYNRIRLDGFATITTDLVIKIIL